MSVVRHSCPCGGDLEMEASLAQRDAVIATLEARIAEMNRKLDECLSGEELDTFAPGSPEWKGQRA